MTDSEQVSMSKEALDYIATWVIDEVDDYKGKSINEKLETMDDYTETSLYKALESAIDAWNGGARNGE